MVLMQVIANRTSSKALSYWCQSRSYVDILRISHIMHSGLDLLIAVGSAAIF